MLTNNPNNSRSLAHIEQVSWIKRIPNADNIELIGILGWQCIAKIGEFKIHDKALYIEIDSLVPSDDPRFKFLESKKYKVKTMKLGKKFGSPISQGLALPLNEFPEFKDLPVGTDVTEQLGIIYHIAEDNKRKSSSYDPNAQYKRISARHPKLFKHPLMKKIMKNKTAKKLIIILFSKQSDKPKAFPSWVKKTDEERIENIFDRINFDIPYIVTEKIDGTSATFTMRRKTKSLFRKEKYDYAVCSRNIRQLDRDQKDYHNVEANVYWEMSDKYKIKDILTEFLNTHPNNEFITLQGEIYGESIQGNPYKMNYRDLAIFNLIIDGERYSTPDMAIFCEIKGLNHVPILSTHCTLPSSMEEIKEQAEGKSELNPNVLREGLVYRDDTGSISFKNVSNSYLLKHGG